MKQQNALVTGANSGMGKALCRELVLRDFMVIMLCRDRERGNKALEEIKKETGKNNVILMICDLSSLQEIKKCSQKIINEYYTEDNRIKNPGVITVRRSVTKDDFELQFGVNHLGHFLLTLSLMPCLVKSDSARIVITASGAHKIGKIHFDNIQLENKYTLWRAYGQSKLANILFCYELSRKLLEKNINNITVNCFHPGAVATNMGINRKTGFGTFITKLLKPFFKTPEEGADTGIYLATSSVMKGISGKYFIDRNEQKSSPLSYDRQIASRLWEISEKMTGISWENIIEL
ncbi:MAG: SDR family oxidoreductase [Spirochaetaceae bacterium]|jgi:NAD(P)-dependent dehydrogenase (short-subunit alcohol dehydrogenase family)|nr:SDR family oxidoreductase [Spirochaetaceae bacterium]